MQGSKRVHDDGGESDGGVRASEKREDVTAQEDTVRRTLPARQERGRARDRVKCYTAILTAPKRRKISTERQAGAGILGSQHAYTIHPASLEDASAKPSVTSNADTEEWKDIDHLPEATIYGRLVQIGNYLRVRGKPAQVVDICHVQTAGFYLHVSYLVETRRFTNDNNRRLPHQYARSNDMEIVERDDISEFPNLKNVKYDGEISPQYTVKDGRGATLYEVALESLQVRN